MHASDTYLQQGSDRISRDATVRIGDQVLDVDVAARYGSGVDHRQLVQRFDGGKLEHRLGRREEQLEDFGE